MTTAVKVIKGALGMIGAHSEVMPADPSLIKDALPYLQELLDELANSNIVLEYVNDSDVTVSVTNPTTLTTDLTEPPGSRIKIQTMLAADLVPMARIPLERLTVGPMREVNRANAYHSLAVMFRKVTHPTITPSALLPRGQGTQRGSQSAAFFGGNDLDNDASTTS